MRRIKLRHLQCLVAVAAHGRVGEAAQALGVSQPAVSKSLAELEEIVGAELFVRSGRGVALTEPGRTLLGYAGSSLRTLREGMDHVMGAAPAEAESIALGVLPTVAASIAPQAVREFLRKRPGTRVSVHVGINADLLARLARGELDLLLGRVAEPAGMIGVSYEHLYAEPLVVVAGPAHPLAGRRRVAPQELGRYPMMMPLAGTAIRHVVDAFMLRHGVELAGGAIETISDSFARAYVRGGEALWFIAQGVVEEDLRLGSLARLACDTRDTSASVGLTMHGERVPTPGQRALAECIRAVAAQRRAQAAFRRGA